MLLAFSITVFNSLWVIRSSNVTMEDDEDEPRKVCISCNSTRKIAHTCYRQTERVVESREIQYVLNVLIVC